MGGGEDVCSLYDGRFLRRFNEKMDRTRGTDQLKERERAEIHSGTVIKGSAMKNEFLIRYICSTADQQA